MRIARVILDIPTQALDQAYSYSVPEDMEGVEVGCSVCVPFARRRALGFVMSVSEAEDAEAAGFGKGGLKAIEAVAGRSFFDENAAACARFLADRYLAPLSSCVRLFTPPGGVPSIVKRDGSWQLVEPSVGQVDDRWAVLGPEAGSYEPPKRAVKQRAIMSALQAGALRVSELSTEYGRVSSSLAALERRGAVRIERRRRFRGACDGRDPGASAPPDASPGGSGSPGPGGDSGSRVRAVEYAVRAIEACPKPELTADQEAAVAEIRRARRCRDGRVVVLDGVTGSGKTEVYLRAIEDVLLEGRTAIVLVPEISLTPQTVARFRGRFGDMVAVLHSRMSQGERYDQWDFIGSGAARVVVGARSALFAPLRDIGLIVIDEEHEGSYKQDQAPRYVARDVAEWMVGRYGATLVLGSATPSIEALAKADACGRWSLVRMPSRVNGRPLPGIEVVDMAREFGGGNRSMFSLALRTALERALRAGRKAVLLLNQRGFANFVLCRDCGFVPECPNCSTSLTYHERGNRLMCHHCGYEQAVPPTCPVCAGPYLRKFGAGTQRVESELRSFLDGLSDVDAKVIRMDADTTAAKGAHRRLLEEFASSDAAVLLGTQMIAKGLDFDDVVLVGVINADTQLRLPDFRSGERTFDLIEQVAGRAGRARLEGTVIVQTYNPEAVPIRAAAAYDRRMLLDDELAKRRELGYPPFVRLANVLVWGADEDEVRAQARALHGRMRDALERARCSDWILLPSTPCAIGRIRGNWRYHITLKAPPDADIGSVLQPVFRERRASKTVNVSVDVDPVSML